MSSRHREMVKRMHEHDVYLELAVLIGASVQTGGGASGTLNGMLENYDHRLTDEMGVPEDLVAGGDVCEIADWLIYAGKDGWLCEFEARHPDGLWRAFIVYGDSIEACLDTAIIRAVPWPAA